MRSIAVGVLALALAPSVALAQLEGQAELDSLEEEARGLFHAGSAAYDRADYEVALDYFQRAYELSHRPLLLFNIGHTAERAREDARAVEAFEAYLRAAPDAENRPNVEARIARLRRQIAEAGARPPSPAPAPAPADEGPGAGPWVLVISGAVLAIGGAVMLGASTVPADAVSSAPEGTPWVDVAGDYDAALYLSAFGFVGIGVGAALALGGVVWLAAGGGAGADAVALGIGPGGVRLRGAFR